MLTSALYRMFRLACIRTQQNLCFYCKRRMDATETRSPRAATLDHMVPLALGGETRTENLVAACRTCNECKGDLTADDFRVVMENYHRDTQSDQM